MTRTLHKSGLALAGALCAAFCSAPANAQQPQPYTLTDLGTLGGQQSITQGINDNGQVIGTSNRPGDILGHGYLYSYDPESTPAGLPYSNILLDLGTFGGGNSNARAITNNLRADIVGYAETGSVVNGRHVTHAFVYTLGGEFNQDTGAANSPTTFSDLGTLGGLISVAFGIYQVSEQSQTQIVGGAETGGRDPNNPVSHAFLHFGSGQINPATDDLGVLPTYTDSSAYAIYPGGSKFPSGVIVGSSFSFYGALSQATLFSQGRAPKSLGTLPGGVSSDAYAANASMAVGDSDYHGGPFVPVTFSLSTPPAVTRVPLLPGFTTGTAYAVNSAGAIVGTDSQTDAQGNPTKIHAFLYTGGASSYDLNSLLSPASAGNTVEEASGINSFGQISADGLNVNGQLHAFLLSPTPVVTSLNPNQVGQNSTPTIYVNGANFTPDSVVYYNGTPVPDEEYISPTQILAELPNVGSSSNSAVIDVGAPTPGGNSQTLLIGFANLGITFGQLTYDAATDPAHPAYVLSATLTNSGSNPATNIQTSLSANPPMDSLQATKIQTSPGHYTMGPVVGATSATPAAAFSLAPGQSQTITLRFPASALPPNTMQSIVRLRYTFNGGAGGQAGAISTSRSYGTVPTH